MTNAAAGTRVSVLEHVHSRSADKVPAIVTKISSQPPSTVRLKAAAAFTESGETSDTVRQLWQCTDDNRQELIDKVDHILYRFPGLC
jgi:hypothetical protein